MSLGRSMPNYADCSILENFFSMDYKEQKDISPENITSNHYVRYMEYLDAWHQNHNYSPRKALKEFLAQLRNEFGFLTTTTIIYNIGCGREEDQHNDLLNELFKPTTIYNVDIFKHDDTVFKIDPDDYNLQQQGGLLLEMLSHYPNDKNVKIRARESSKLLSDNGVIVSLSLAVAKSTILEFAKEMEELGIRTEKYGILMLDNNLHIVYVGRKVYNCTTIIILLFNYHIS
jgi:hypothetical protein